MAFYDGVGKLGDKNLVPEFGTFAPAREETLQQADASMMPYLFRNMNEVVGHRTIQVRHGDNLRPLPNRDGVRFDDALLEHVQAEMARWGVVGLLAVQSGEVVFESYRCGNTDQSRSVVHSVTKSVTSTLIAGAIREGLVDIEAKLSTYLPELAGADFGDSTIRSMLNMSSGVNQPETDPDASPLDQRRKVYRDTRPEAVTEWLATHQRYAEPGAAYEYVDYNFYLLSEVLRRVYDRPYEELLVERIWIPAGMQHDAYIRTTHAGKVDGHGGLSMTLRDMARLGLFVMDSFHGTGGPLVPDGWFQGILDASASTGGVRSPGSIPMAPPFGYELGWWPHPGVPGEGGNAAPVRCFSAQGVFGQTIFVFPERDAVLVSHAASMMHDGAAYDAILRIGDALLRAAE